MLINIWLIIFAAKLSLSVKQRIRETNMSELFFYACSNCHFDEEETVLTDECSCGSPSSEAVISMVIVCRRCQRSFNKKKGFHRKNSKEKDKISDPLMLTATTTTTTTTTMMTTVMTMKMI